MKRHNILVTVNGISKSRAQWAKEVGVTKGSVSHRESKGESASSAIGNIIGTMHSRKVLEHYERAKEMSPYFCDKIDPVDLDKEDKEGLADYRESVKRIVSDIRSDIEVLIKKDELNWNYLVLCELWEAVEAIANGDTAHAVEKFYDAIAVLLRTIDVLEGRQKLGKPEMGRPQPWVPPNRLGEDPPVVGGQNRVEERSGRRI